MLLRADVLVAIVGDRYGTVVDDRSCTEYEFDTATDLGLTRLVFLVDSHTSFLPPADQSAVDRGRQVRFRSRLLTAGITLTWVTSPAELELSLYQALMELVLHVRCGCRLR